MLTYIRRQVRPDSDRMGRWLFDWYRGEDGEPKFLATFVCDNEEDPAPLSPERASERLLQDPTSCFNIPGPDED